MRIVALLIMMAALALVGCASGEAGARQASGPPIGADCRLQFKRSDLGVAASLPVAPTVGSINGADVNVRGKLLRIDKEWVVLDAVVDAGLRSELWVPRGNVLLLQFP